MSRRVLEPGHDFSPSLVLQKFGDLIAGCVLPGVQ